MTIKPIPETERLDATALIREALADSIKVKQAVSDHGAEIISDISLKCADAISEGNKLLLCGNGGSAADAQHLAAELLVRMRPTVNRRALPAIALTLDVSTITACSNDYGYEMLYERMVEALGKRGDVLIGISTSGKSVNVLRALERARAMGIHTVGLLGADGGPALRLCDLALVVPSTITSRIQEAHIAVGHILMELVEEHLRLRGLIMN